MHWQQEGEVAEKLPENKGNKAAKFGFKMVDISDIKTSKIVSQLSVITMHCRTCIKSDCHHKWQAVGNMVMQFDPTKESVQNTD